MLRLPADVRSRLLGRLRARDLCCLARSCPSARAWLALPPLWAELAQRYFPGRTVNGQQQFGQLYRERPSGSLVPVRPAGAGRIRLGPDELTAELWPGRDLRQPAVWLTVGDRRLRQPSRAEIQFGPIDEEAEAVVAVAHAPADLPDWPLAELALKVPDPGGERLALLALASNGYKFNGHGAQPGGRRGFRRCGGVSVSVDFGARRVEFEVGSCEAGWEPAASFRLPAHVASSDRYVVLAGVKGWRGGSQGDMARCSTGSRVQLMRFEMGKEH